MSAEERLGYYELKKNKPKLLNQRKYAKCQWLQDPNETTWTM
jgi:hypothetical protein